MGYVSHIVIALHKSVLAEDLISPLLPECLRRPEESDIETFTTDLAQYWILRWKWWPDFPEVAVMQEFLETLAERVWFTDPLYHNGEILLCPVGALRIGEDDGDQESWGSPESYDIMLTREITYPRPSETSIPT